MCECFARVFGVSWSPAASYAAEGRPPGSQEAFRIRHRAPAQKEKLHAELKRVLQKKGEIQRSEEEEEEEEETAPLACREMEAQLRAMEKTIETSELLEVVVETEAQTGVSGMSVAGDQLLSARVYFEDVKYEDALQILRCVEPYKVSFWLKRTVPGVEVARKPGTATFEVKGPKAKLAKLNIRSLRPLQRKRRKKRKVATGLREPQGLEPGPLDVEFSLPRFSRLRKAKSAGEVAEPKPDPAPRPSPLETKRRRVKFPRLKVKDVAAAAAARAEGRLEVGLLKAAVAGKAAGRGAAEGKGPRFTVPFPKKKSKKPREGAAAKVGAGLQAPQVELDLPLPKAGPGGGSPKVGAKGEGLRLQAPLPGLPKLEAALPTVSAGGLGGPESSLHAGLRLPTAEVAAPRVDVDLSLPKWGGAAATPEAALQGKGVRISAEGVEVKLPALEVALGRGRGAAEGPEEPPRLVGTLPALEVEAPLVDLELPLPKGKADAELPKPRLEVPGVSVKVPAVGLPKLGAQCHEELEGKLPQVELSVGGASESPRAKAPTIPGLGASLLESKVAGAAGGKAAHPPGLTIPALALSLPSVADLDVAAKAVPPPPPAPTREPKPEGGVGVTADVPRLDLALPGVKVPRPELDIAVERPAVEVAVPSPRLSFPSAAVPTLDINVPKAGVELGPLKAEGRLEGKRKVPTLEALGKELEISIPPCGEGPSELGLSGAVLEGSEVSGVVAKLPKVVLALGKEPLGAGGAEGRPLPKAGLEMETSGAGAKAKLPLVEISAAKRPEVASEADRALEAEARLKLPKFALPKFSISSPKAGKGGAEAEAPDVAGRGARLRMPKFGISFPRAKRGGEAEGPGVALGLGGGD
ncbi:hypothetical protein lerEdw1_009959 [Lerista edwardsae]|nr:hypothetical protein lerEdw1_009959 [Lerista edwardsae]